MEIMESERAQLGTMRGMACIMENNAQLGRECLSLLHGMTGLYQGSHQERYASFMEICNFCILGVHAEDPFCVEVFPACVL